MDIICRFNEYEFIKMWRSLFNERKNDEIAFFSFSCLQIWIIYKNNAIMEQIMTRKIWLRTDSRALNVQWNRNVDHILLAQIFFSKLLNFWIFFSVQRLIFLWLTRFWAAWRDFDRIMMPFLAPIHEKIDELMHIHNSLRHRAPEKKN